jgi:ribonuclease D
LPPDPTPQAITRVPNPRTSSGPYDHVTTDSQLEQLVLRLAGHSHVAFDTEFVSEHTYRSQLCLLQVAALVAHLQVVVARVELKVVLLVQVAPEEEVNELFF